MYLGNNKSIRCPCCNENLHAEIINGEIVLYNGTVIELSEDEIKKLIQEKGIEFG